MTTITQDQLSYTAKADAKPDIQNTQKSQNAGFAKAVPVIGSYKIAIILVLLMMGAMLTYAFCSFRPIDDPWTQALAKPCAAEKTCVVIASLQGDSKAAQTDHIINELQHLFAGGLKGNTDVQIISRPINLDRQLTGRDQTRKTAAEVKARRWLKKQQADILVYGRVDKKARALELSLLPTATNSSANGEEVALPPIINRLPLSFPETMSGVFLAALQSQGYAIVKDYNLSYSARFIHEKIDHLAADMPEGLSPQTAAEAHLMFALSAYQEGERYVHLDDVNLAIEHMQKAIDLTLGERETSEWSQKNYYLARMLETKYKFGQVTVSRHDQMKVLEHIIGAYRSAQVSGAAANDLEKWGESQIRFSSALLNLGGFRGDEELIDESMNTSQKALTVFTKDSPRHIKNRTSATLWYALALNRKGELLAEKELNTDALQILKNLHSNTSRQAEISVSVNKKLQNLINHLEKQQGPVPSL